MPWSTCEFYLRVKARPLSEYAGSEKAPPAQRSARAPKATRVLSCGRLVFMAKAARDNRQTRASEGCTREEGAREGFHSGRTLFGADDEQMVGLLVEVDAAPTSEAAERGLLVRIACTRHEPEPSYGRQSPVHVSSTCCTPTSPAVRRRCMQCKRILMGCATRPQTTTHSCDAEVVLMRRRSHDSTRCDAMR